MGDKLFIDDDGDICIEGREDNLIACAAMDYFLGQYRPLNPDVIQEIVQRWNAHDDLTSEVTQLRADLANAGAVMVEAALRLPAYDSDGDPAGQFDQQVFVRRDDLRALSTLSPIAAAAGLVADGIDADMRTFNQCLDEEPATGETKAGHFFAQILRRYSRALAEQEKAE